MAYLHAKLSALGNTRLSAIMQKPNPPVVERNAPQPERSAAAAARARSCEAWSGKGAGRVERIQQWMKRAREEMPKASAVDLARVGGEPLRLPAPLERSAEAVERPRLCRCAFGLRGVEWNEGRVRLPQGHKGAAGRGRGAFKRSAKPHEPAPTRKRRPYGRGGGFSLKTWPQDFRVKRCLLSKIKASSHLDFCGLSLDSSNSYLICSRMLQISMYLE